MMAGGAEQSKPVRNVRVENPSNSRRIDGGTGRCT